MNISKVETLTGKLEALSSLKQTRKGNRWYFGVKVNDMWFNKFGSEEDLSRIVAGLEKGLDVKIQFRTRIVNGTTFREVVSISPIEQGSLPAHSFDKTFIPVSQTWGLVEDGKLNIERLKMALKCVEADCRFLLDELNKVKE